MLTTTSKAKVYIDTSGIAYEIPILLTESGPIESLIDYFTAHWDHRSTEWMKKVLSAARLFIEYMHANPLQKDTRQLFLNFRLRLFSGTIDHQAGNDPSNLWWNPRNPNEIRRIIVNLTDYFNWRLDIEPSLSNPNGNWVGSLFDQNIARAAYEYRRNRAFLGHTWSVHQQIKANNSKSKTLRIPVTEADEPISFPEERIMDLLFKGFKVGDHYDYRGMLITLLLNGAGFRESEPFHLYLWDVMEDPMNPGHALVLIHHPSEGIAPSDPKWVDVKGKRKKGKRAEYLAQRFGLTPRDWQLGTSASGWKGGMHESQLGGYYKRAYWFIPKFGELFWQIWHVYVKKVNEISIDKRNHPYAFINIMREPKGEIYKLGKYETAHAAAVRRIGLIPAKSKGTSIHGHRHAYGQRLRKAEMSKEMIRRFMHHADLNSQEVYTQAAQNECLAAIKIAMERISNKHKIETEKDSVQSILSEIEKFELSTKKGEVK